VRRPSPLPPHRARGPERDRMQCANERKAGSGCTVRPNTVPSIYRPGDYGEEAILVCGPQTGSRPTDRRTPTASDALKNTQRWAPRVSLLVASRQWEPGVASRVTFFICLGCRVWCCWRCSSFHCLVCPRIRNQYSGLQGLFCTCIIFISFSRTLLSFPLVEFVVLSLVLSLNLCFQGIFIFFFRTCELVVLCRFNCLVLKVSNC
jgi:hypothetical protein